MVKRVLIAAAIALAAAAPARAQVTYGAQWFRLVPYASTPTLPSGHGALYLDSTNSNHLTLRQGGLSVDLINCLTCTGNAGYIGGYAVSASAPSSGQFLIYGSNWAGRLLQYSDLTAPSLVGTGASQLANGADARFPPAPGTAGNFVVDNTSGYTSRRLAYSDLTTPSLVGAVANTVAPGNDQRLPIDCVSQYGASTGASDNTTAINNCISAAASDSARRYAYIAAGTYHTTGQITMASGTELRGAGLGQTVIAFDGTTGSAITFTGTNTTAVRHLTLRYTSSSFTGDLMVSGTSSIARFERVYFQGQGAGGVIRTAARLVNLTKAIEYYFNDCIFAGATTAIQGVVTTGFSDTVTVENSLFQNIATYFVLNPELNWRIVHDTFEPDIASQGGSGKMAGIANQTAPLIQVQGLIIAGNYFSDETATAGLQPVLDLECWGCDIYGNYFNLTNNANVQASSIVVESGTRGWHFHGNTVIGSDAITLSQACNTSNYNEIDWPGNFWQTVAGGTGSAPLTCIGGTQSFGTVNTGQINATGLSVSGGVTLQNSLTTLADVSHQNAVLATRSPWALGETTFSNANYTILSYDNPLITQTGTLTAARNVTIDPTKGNSIAPHLLIITDNSGTASQTNAINGVPSSSTLNGVSSLPLLQSPYETQLVFTNGSIAWSPNWLTKGDVRTPAVPGGSGTILYSNGSNWIASTLVMPNAATTGDILTATSSNTVGRLAIDTNTAHYLKGGTTPAWGAIAAGDMPVMVGATSGSGGTQGAVPAPAAGQQATAFLRADGTWQVPAGSGTVTSVTCGTGLTGGTFTTSGTCAIDYTVGPSWTAAETITVTGVGTASTAGLTVQNTTAAANGTQQDSPLAVLSGTGWASTGGTSQTDKFALQVQPVQGTTNSTASLAVMHSINGAGYTTDWTFGSDGSLANNSGTITASTLQRNAGNLNVCTGLTTTCTIGIAGTTHNITVNGPVLFGQSLAPGYRTAASTIAAANTDYYIGVTGTGSRTVNLFAVSTCVKNGQTLVIFDAGNSSGTITIAPNGTDNINSVNSSVTIAQAAGRRTFTCDTSLGWIATAVQ